MSEKLKIDTSGLDPNRNRELIEISEKYNAGIDAQSGGPSNKNVVTAFLVIGVAFAAWRALGAENTTGQGGNPDKVPYSAPADTSNE